MQSRYFSVPKILFIIIAMAVFAPFVVSLSNSFAQSNDSTSSSSSSSLQQLADSVIITPEETEAENVQNSSSSQTLTDSSSISSTQTQKDESSKTDVAVKPQMGADLQTPAMPAVTGLFINEVHFMGQNTANPDWIELYNSTSSAINLTGLLLEDSGANQLVLSGTISANSFLTVDFKPNFYNALNNAGDTVVIKDALANVIDKLSYGSAGNFNLGNVQVGDTVARINNASTTLIKRRSSGVTKNVSNNCAAGQVINQTSNTAFCSIQEAIDDAAAGDSILLENGNYTVNSTINISKSLTISGQSKTGVNINMSGLNGYGFSVSASNVTLQNLTVMGTVGGDGARTFKFGTGPANSVISNGKLANITVNAGTKTPFDIHGVDGFIAENLTANGTTAGNGLSFSGVTNAMVNNFAGSNNVWGDIAIYTSTFVNRGSSNIRINNSGNLRIFGQDASTSLRNEVNSVTVDGRIRYTPPLNSTLSPNTDGLFYVYITPLQAPTQIGYNSSSTTAANNRPAQLACGIFANPVITSHNEMSVLWDWSGANPFSPLGNILYQRQYNVNGGDWTGSEIYSDLNTDYRSFGFSAGNSGIYGSRVRAFVDVNNNGFDSGDFISYWSNECYIEFDSFVYPNYPLKTSTLSIAKTDQNGSPLPNWRFDLERGGETISSLNIAVANGTKTATNYPAGTYNITVSGTYRYGSSEMISDAGYSKRPNLETWQDKFVVKNGAETWLNAYRWIQDNTDKSIDLSLRINDECTVLLTANTTCWNNKKDSGLVYWGTFNPANSYTIPYQHAGGEMHFSVRDDSFGDNDSGSLSVQIAPVLVSGVTNSAGNLQLTVPAGQYDLTEILQPGWQFVSRSDAGQNGDLVDLSGNKSITVVNRLIPVIINPVNPQPVNPTPTPAPTPGGNRGGNAPISNTNNTSNIAAAPVQIQTETEEITSNEDTDKNEDADDENATNVVEINPSNRGRNGQVAGTQDQRNMCRDSQFPWWVVVLMVLNLLLLIFATAVSSKRADEEDEE